MTIVDGLTLPSELRTVLRPGEIALDFEGNSHRLPRYFYALSRAHACELKLTSHFSASELMNVDCREAAALFHHPTHYVPCGVVILARYLQELRQRVAAPIYVAANGGYRSPAHRRNREHATPHHWAMAADIYRIGDIWLDAMEPIQFFKRIAQSLGPEVRVKPFGHGPGESDDHLHLDLGYVNVVPHGFSD